MERFLRIRKKRMSLLLSSRSKPSFWRPIALKLYLVMLTLISSKVVEKINLENISNHVKGKEVIGRSQHTFMKRKLCLMNGIVLHDEVIGMVKDG